MGCAGTARHSEASRTWIDATRLFASINQQRHHVCCGARAFHVILCCCLRCWGGEYWSAGCRIFSPSGAFGIHSRAKKRTGPADNARRATAREGGQGATRPTTTAGRRPFTCTAKVLSAQAIRTNTQLPTHCHVEWRRHLHVRRWVAEEDKKKARKNTPIQTKR